MSHENLSIIATFIVYLIGLLIIGRVGEKKHSQSYEDFVSAGKSLGGLVTAISAAASSESVWVMLGLSGLGYFKGAAALWAALGCIAGFVFNALFVTVQLRRESQRLGALTISDYVALRLGDRSGILRVVSALIISFFMMSYVVAQFTGSGDLIHGMALFGPDTPYWLGVVIGAVVIALYIVMGGYAAVCWTDTVQGLLMFVVMLLLPALAIVEAGGPAALWTSLDQMGLLSLGGGAAAGWASVGFVAGQLGIAIGYPGMPHMIVRYMTVRDDTEARKAALISVAWAAVVLVGSALVGVATRVLAPDLVETQKQAEQQVIPFICHSYLPSVLTGVVLSAVTAAIMSTADSQLMYAATSLINDVWLRGREGKALDGQRLIWLTRALLLGMTALAMVVALLKMRLIYTFVLFAWGALGAAFTPVILLSLYWRRLTRWGALASFVVGPLVIVVWYNTPVLHDAVYELIPAFAASSLAAVGVSLLTWRREQRRVSPAVKP